ncbi:hypothetical protein POL68_40585 [Stigmatella sp. ncwal1]|uniref:DUF7151 domain-containing protein n=1 Tax=Stigmatella ashevillensis TaxID=2995309 RepID=A0ABT5DMP9_9BACT|nr:hypothetical protein [Stigmatella ashevillena]MDC0714816.1 hypothetical protein [Stigmatella ashevillena]
MFQQWSLRRSVMAGFVLALTSCASPSGDGTNGKDASVRLIPEPPGARCPLGGTAIQTGLDDNGDGELNDSEVRQTSFVCSGGSTHSSGKMSLVKLLPEEGTARCSSGGIAVLSGLDANADGLQNDSEVTSTQYVCNSADGLSGTAYVVKMLPESAGANCPAGGTSVLGGIDVNTDGQLGAPEVTATQYVCQSATSLTGANALIRLDVEPAGANCTQGGTAVKSGLDSNENGILDADEVSNTTFVCNGRTGATGQNGKNALVRLDPEPAGPNCAYGGTAVKSGLDANGDGSLSNLEVQTTQLVCSAANFFRTKWASNPPGTYESGEIANPWVPVGRRVSLYKTSDTSRIKITVSDNLRVGYNSTTGGNGVYSVRMNGSSMGCDAYQYNWNASGSNQNYFQPFANVCLTEQLPKGLYEFDAWAVASGGTSYVGAGTGSNAVLLAEELDGTKPYAFSKVGSETATTSTSFVKANGRDVTFVKQSATTLLKVTLADTLGVAYNQNAVAGTVMVQLDGANTNCYTGQHDAQGANADIRKPFVLTCILPNVSATRHTLQVAFMAMSGTPRLGWARSNPLLLVEEIPSTGLTYSNAGVASGELSGYWAGVGARQILHNVSTSGKTVKFTYSDTFRATLNCNGYWGFFELYIDNQPSGCSNAQYMASGAAQDHHHPVNLTCITPNLTAGTHTFAIWSTTQQWNASSCGSNYFGWNRGQNLLLVEEMP